MEGEAPPAARLNSSSEREFAAARCRRDARRDQRRRPEPLDPDDHHRADWPRRRAARTQATRAALDTRRPCGGDRMGAACAVSASSEGGVHEQHARPADEQREAGRRAGQLVEQRVPRGRRVLGRVERAGRPRRPALLRARRI